MRGGRRQGRRGRGAAPHLRARRVPELIAAPEEQSADAHQFCFPPGDFHDARHYRRSSAGRCSRRRGRMRSPARRRCSRSSCCCRSACPAARRVPSVCLGLLRLRAGGLLAPQVLLLEFLERRAVEERLRPPEREARLLLAALGRNRRPPLVHAERRQPRAEPLVEGGLVVDTHLPTGGDEEVTMRGSTDRGSYGGRGALASAAGAATGWWRDCATA